MESDGESQNVGCKSSGHCCGLVGSVKDMECM